jgi:hypothetical protein
MPETSPGQVRIDKGLVTVKNQDKNTVDKYANGNYAIPVSFNYRDTELKFKASLVFENEFEFNKLGHRDAVKTLKTDINRIWKTNSVYFEPESQGSTACKINGKVYNVQIQAHENKWDELALFPSECRYLQVLSVKATQKVVAELEAQVKQWHWENIYRLRKLHFDEYIQKQSKQLEEYLIRIEEIKLILKVDNGN